MTTAHDNTTVNEHLETALAMHDQLLLNRPDGAPHDEVLCPFCADWSMAEEGTPSGGARLEFADAKQPYGKIEYADPGYQEDGVKRYPIDTEAHARAAWSYIHQAGNTEKYTADQLTAMREKIQAALKKFGIEAQKLNAEMPVKVAKAANDSNPSGNASNKATDSKTSHKDQSAASEGGTSPMETMTHDTHDALLDKALRDATASLEAEKAELVTQVATLTEQASASAEEITSLKADNARITGELDTAQLSLNTVQTEVDALKADVASKDEAARKAAIASERAEQVKNLSLFSEEYVADKSALWADMADEAWTERIEEWKSVKGAAPAGSTTSTDVASAITGSSETPAGQQASARRAALGLN